MKPRVLFPDPRDPISTIDAFEGNSLATGLAGLESRLNLEARDGCSSSVVIAILINGTAQHWVISKF